MRSSKHIIGAIFLLSLTPSLWAQEQLELSLDTSVMRIGEQTKATLSLSGQGDPGKYAWPLLHDTLMAGIEIIKAYEPDTSFTENGSFTLSRELLITSFDTGIYIFDDVAVMDTSGGDTVMVKAPPAYLEIFTLTVEQGSEISDIKPPIAIPFTFREAVPYILGAVAAIILALLLWYVLSKRKEGKPVFRPVTKPRAPAHVIALEALDNLRKKKLWQEGKVKIYHSELTDILRNYLNGRFGIPAMEMVTHEIAEAMEELNELNEHQQKKLADIFELADLVKFARWQPLPDENDNSLKGAIYFVRETIPVSTLQSERNEGNPIHEMQESG